MTSISRRDVLKGAAALGFAGSGFVDLPPGSAVFAADPATPPASQAKPYPDSTFITGCRIAPEVRSYPDNVVRPGDCWPATWAGDDALYTFFNDGPGFTTEKSSFSMHPARITGNPPELTGANLKTNATGKGVGGGARGRKVSGLIALPDPSAAAGFLLAAWVRNITPQGGASLLYSRDCGANWAWAWGDPASTPSAVIPELGYPAWMQAGRNYGAARDSYLYFYSQDRPRAYQRADHVILGRVPMAHVLDRSRYEYFCGTPSASAWTPEISRRTPAFSAPDQCYRLHVTFNPPLGRYFLLTANGDRMSTGYVNTHNLGIYEAPNPWGPWATVYWNNAFHPDWNVFGPQMVPKWISPDGRAFYLLFSCFDRGPYKFNLQKVTLITSE